MGSHFTNVMILALYLNLIISSQRCLSHTHTHTHRKSDVLLGIPWLWDCIIIRPHRVEHTRPLVWRTILSCDTKAGARGGAASYFSLLACILKFFSQRPTLLWILWIRDGVRSWILPRHLRCVVNKTLGLALHTFLHHVLPPTRPSQAPPSVRSICELLCVAGVKG